MKSLITAVLLCIALTTMVGCDEPVTQLMLQKPTSPNNDFDDDINHVEPESMIEITEDFQPSWAWLKNNIVEAQKYRKYIMLQLGFGPATTFNHYRDPETFTTPGRESLLSIKYEDNETKSLLPDLSGWNLPWYTVISYDPSKIEILTESEEPPPEFRYRVCGWLSDVHFSHVRSGDGHHIDRVTPDTAEKNEKFSQVILENMSNGKSVQIKRTSYAHVQIKYRYLGGGDAYIFVWRNAPYTEAPNEGHVVGIKVTSEDL